MKRVISIGILAVLVFNICGLYVAYLWIHAGAREEFREKLHAFHDDKRSVSITFNKDEIIHIQWFGDDEFRYSGNMVDVTKKTVHADGSVTFYGFVDKAETTLFAYLDKNTEVPSGQTGKTNFPVKVLFYFMALVEKNYPDLENFRTGNSTFSHFLNSIHSNPVTDRCSPPPELFNLS